MLTARRGVRRPVISVIDPRPVAVPVPDAASPSNEDTTVVRMLVALVRPPVSDDPSPEAPADSTERDSVRITAYEE